MSPQERKKEEIKNKIKKLFAHEYKKYTDIEYRIASIGTPLEIRRNKALKRWLNSPTASATGWKQHFSESNFLKWAETNLGYWLDRKLGII